MKRLTLFAAIMLVGLLIGTLAAKKGELELKDGRQLIGDISETADGYSLTQPGVGSVSFNKADVKNVEYFDTPEQGYQQKKSRLAKDDVDGLFKLAQWAQRNQLNEQMGDALKAVLAVRPDHMQARLLMKVYERNKAAGPDTGNTGVKPPVNPDKTATPPTATGPADRISDSDINKIRLLELRPGEPLKMSFNPGAIDAVWRQIEAQDPDLRGETHRKKFLGLPVHQQLREAMARLPQSEYYDLAEKVTFRQDPAAMTTFKTKINSWLVSSCGSTTCHGGNATAPFRLVNTPPNNDNAIYTNFLIVSEFVGKDNRKLLDRDRPEDSLLLQYALPTDATEVKFRHPLVNGRPIPPALKNRTGVYQIILKWLTDRDHGGIRGPLERMPYRIDFPIGRTFPPTQVPPGGPPAVPPGPRPPIY